MVTVAQQQHQNNEEEQNGRHNTGDHRAVIIRDVVEDETTIDYPPSSVGTSSLEDKGYGTDAAVCIKSDSEFRRLDHEDVSQTSSTQYSDVDDSLAEDELGSWSNDLDLPVSLQQNFDNGVALPISEVPNFGDVCVKNSANVHFGNKTFYNGPVTIKQIVYANPNATEDGESGDIRYDADKLPKNGNPGFTRDECRTSGKNAKMADTENLEDDYKVKQWCAWLLTWRCVALMCAMGSCLVASVVVSVVLLSRDSKTAGSVSFPQIPVSGSDGISTKLRFVERAEWGAQPPSDVMDKLHLPVPYVIISHTVTDFCETQSECTFRIRFAQTFHIESRNWSDIAYNFLIGGDGYAYVGRSWEYVGAHSYSYNTKSIGISFIGTFNKVVPPEHQLIAAQQLIQFGVEHGKIARDYKLLGHRQISKTLSPGDALYSVIQTWPNWSPTP